VLFDQFKELPDLVELRLSLLVLHVDDFRYGGVLEEVVAAARPRQAKTKRFDQRDHVADLIDQK
jgi:hypothetical protein